jgi:CRISPR-associated protein Cpf1
MPKHTFANFTNLYELSKTLRFELKPQFNTKYFLEQDGVIDKDREVEQNYHEIKKYFDNLHRIFTKDSLSNAYLSLLQDFSQSYLELHKNVETKKDKKLQKVFENVSKELKKELVSFFENT